MALLLTAALLAATDGGFGFEWIAPESCPGEGSVRARLGPDLAGRVRAEVIATEVGFELRIDVDGSTRRLSTSTCEEAADAALLVIRLALTPAPPQAKAAPSPALPAVAAPAPPPPTVLGWGLHAAAVAAVDFFWLPRPLFFVGGSVTARIGPVALVVDAMTSLSQRYSGGPTPDAAVEVRVPFALDAGLCWLFSSGRLRGGPCLTGGPAWLSAQGMNVTDPRTSTAVLWSVVPSGRVTVAIGFFELHARAGLRLGAAPRVAFAGGPPVVQGSQADLLVSLGAGAGF